MDYYRVNSWTNIGLLESEQLDTHWIVRELTVGHTLDYYRVNSWTNIGLLESEQLDTH